jgi:hypothetical protein
MKEARVSYLNLQSNDLQRDAKLDKSVLLAIESNRISKTLDDDKLRQKLLLGADQLIRQELLSSLICCGSEP